MAKNPAVDSVAAAIQNPEAHQAPPPGSSGGTPTVLDPVPGNAQKGNAAQQSSGTTPTPPQQQQQQQQAQPSGQQGQQPSGQQPGGQQADGQQQQQPGAVPLENATLEQIVARTRELAGEEGVDQNTVLAADMNATLAKARSQEKDKLYNQIESLKTELTAAQQLSTQQADTIKNLSEKGGDAGGGGGTDGGDKNKDGDGDGFTQEQVNQAITAGLSKMQEAYEAKVGELTNQINSLRESTTQETLGTYRDSLLSQNKGQIIEELVVGNTKEELDNSLVQAKQAYARIAQQLTSDGQAAAASAPAVPPAPTLNPPSAPGNAGTTPGQPGNISLPGSMADFSQNRANILAQASQAARQAIQQLGPS